MSVLIEQELPGATADVVLEIGAQAGIEDDPPRGWLVHAVCSTPNGMRIVDVWRSEQDFQQFQQFQQTRLGPASGAVLARYGITGPPPPPYVVSPIAQLHVTNADTAND